MKADQGHNVRKVLNSCGRQATKTSHLKKNVIRQTMMSPYKVSTRNLATRNNVDKTIIHEIFIERDFKYQSSVSLPKLDEDQMSDRIEYCSDILENNGEKFYGTSLMAKWASDFLCTTTKKPGPSL